MPSHPFVPFPSGTVEALINMTLAGIPAQISLGFKKFTGAASPTDGFSLGSILSGWIGSNLANDVTTLVNFVEVVVNDLTSATGWQAITTVGTPGTDGGNYAPNQVAMCVTLQSAVRGRSQRGRNYLPGVSRDHLQDAKTWAAAQCTTVENDYNSGNLAVIAGGWTPVILSRISGGAYRALGQVTPVANYRANQAVATIRGRLR